MKFTFVETTKFTQRVVKLGLEADLRRLQEELLASPEKGDTEPGTGGLRKVRMMDSTRGQGKSYGARVHYAVARQRGLIYLLFVYGKDEQSKLSAEQKKRLREVVRTMTDER